MTDIIKNKDIPLAMIEEIKESLEKLKDKKKGVYDIPKGNDLARQVYNFRKRGFLFSTIASTLKITEKEAEENYFLYLKTSSDELKKRVLDDNIDDLTELYLELEYLKELAYKNENSSLSGTPASIASLKTITDILKEISDIKLQIYARRDNLKDGEKIPGK